MKSFIIVSIRFYQKFISPLFLPRCRFLPTCSQYALEAFQTHAFWKAFYLTMKRILRCHPYCDGGLDPVPKIKESKSSTLPHSL